MMVLVSTTFVTLPLCSASDQVFRVEPAVKLRTFETYDSVAERRNDLVLFDADATWWAHYVAFVVAQPYAQRDQLVNLIKQVTVVEDIAEKTASAKLSRVRAWNPSVQGEPGGPDANREIERREKELLENGINSTDYAQTEVASVPVNGMLSDGVYSRLFLRIVDAKQVFGRECTLLIVSRVDQTREWARLAHTPIVLPIRVSATTRLVTNSELEGALLTLKRLGKPFAGPILTGPPLEPMRSVATLIALKDAVDRICSDTVQAPRNLR
jgi:hypothetical protein